MSKVTYLFGAGASAEALPIVSKMTERIAYMRNQLQITDLSELGVYPSSSQRYQFHKTALIQELVELEKKLGDHASIDSYAKKLFVSKESDKLETLKLIMSYFFIYEQHVKPKDRRYDAFFASILKSAVHEFLDLRILSWNYDYQFELAYREYLDEKYLSRIQQNLPVIPWRKFAVETKGRFCICKLNGTTAFETEGSAEYWNSLNNLNELSEILIFRFFIESYWMRVAQKTGPRSLISFAWENYEHSEVMKEALKDLDKTEALVIIGYSFPFFNREIDRIIFKKLNPAATIYVQDREPINVINNLKSTLGSDANKYHIEPIKVTPSVDNSVIQFYLPTEL